MNKSAKRVQISDISMNSDYDQPLFALLDNKFFKLGPVDFIEKRNQLEALDNFQSFNQLIKYHIENAETSQKKKIYKLKSQDDNNNWRENQPSNRSNESMKSVYFKIKVKQQTYLGKPALAIYLSDYTDKIKDKLNNLIRQELNDKAQTSESFGSTVSHEMRTPLSSIIFFVKQVIYAIQMNQFTKRQKAESLRHCKLMLSQMYLLQSFVEDLLDLRQMRDGAFSLSSAPFDPNETFDLICSSFEPQL